MNTEFSRPVNATRPPPETKVTATPEECAALALRYGIPGVAALSCHYTLRAEGRGVVRGDLALVATVTQTCVVTLEDFTETLEESATLLFMPAEDAPGDDAPIDLDAPDEVPYEGSTIDLGEAAAEQLALALDPYPRSPEVRVQAAQDVDEGGEDPTAPFASLAALRGKPN